MGRLFADVNWGLVVGFVVGIAGKAIPDAIADSRRRAHDRRMRTLELRLSEARAFLVAADQVRRSAQAVSHSYLVLDGAKGNPDPTVYERSRAELMSAQGRAGDAITDAENAYTALRLLVPAAADAARTYLDLCGAADVHPDERREEREAARRTAETAIQKALGTK